MPKFQVEQDGQKYSVEADNEQHAWEGVQQMISASQVHPDNHGMGTRAQREPDTMVTQGGQQVNTIPYATGMADAIQQNSAGDAGTEGAFSVVPGFNKLGSAIDSGLSQIGINGPGVTGPISYEDRLSQVRGAADANDAMHPIARTVGQVAGIGTTALVAPAVAPEALGTIGSGIATGGLYTGAGAAVDQDGSLADKAKAGLIGLGVGAATGGLLGAAAAGVGGLARAGQRMFPTVGPGADARAAAQRLVDEGHMPQQPPAVVTADSPGGQRAGNFVQGTVFGTPLAKAVEQSRQDLGGAVRSVGADIGTAVDTPVAGGNARAALQTHIDDVVPERIGKLYTKAQAGLDPDALVTLPETQAAIADIAARRQAAHLQGNGSAVDHVLDLATNPGGVTIQGLQDNRTILRQWMQGRGTPPANLLPHEADKIYGALSRDMGNGYETVGGPAARQNWETANAMAARYAERNKLLTSKLLGPGKSDEQLFSTLTSAAGSKGGNVNLLLRAKQAMGQDEWGDFAASAIHNMGRGSDDIFSPDRFLTEYGKLSDAGKNIMFSQAHQKAIADIAETARQFRDYGKMANHSNSANAGSIAGFVVGALRAPFKTLGLALGANGIARLMARPATAQGMANWSNAYARFAQNATRRSARSLSFATKVFALSVADSLGDKSKAKDIEQKLLQAQ